MTTLCFELATSDIVTVKPDGSIYIRATALIGFDEHADGLTTRQSTIGMVIEAATYTEEPCVAIITRKMWDHLHSEFFRQKLNYHVRWDGQWCGVESVMGNGDAVGKCTLHIEPEDPDAWEVGQPWGKEIEANIYRVEDADLDMEHG
jgi:hypothetical protein